MNDELKRNLRTAIMDVIETGDPNFKSTGRGHPGWSLWSEVEDFAMRQRSAFVEHVIARLEEISPPICRLWCCAFHQSGGQKDYPCSPNIFRTEHKGFENQ